MVYVVPQSLNSPPPHTQPVQSRLQELAALNASVVAAWRANDSSRLEEIVVNTEPTSGADAEIAVAFSRLGESAAWRCIRRLFTISPSAEEARDYEALCSALCAVAGISFNFPVWRYPAIRFEGEAGGGHPSFFEERGLIKTHRISDRWLLPDGSGKTEDWLGSGYAAPPVAALLSAEAERILALQGRAPVDLQFEYRRSYIEVTVTGLGSVVLPNRSFYFGRDNFLHCCYFSTDALSDSERNEFSPAMVDCPSPRLRPLFDPAVVWNSSAATALNTLLQVFQLIDRGVFEFFVNADGPSGFRRPGAAFRPLLDHLSRRVSVKSAAASLPVLAVIDEGAPPWRPRFSMSVSEGVIEELRTYGERMSGTYSPVVDAFLQAGTRPGRRIALLSSGSGDLPGGVRQIEAASEVREMGERVQPMQDSLADFIREKALRDLRELGAPHGLFQKGDLLLPRLRAYDLDRAYEHMVGWTAEAVREAPGLLVSLSGTDSMLTFVVCSAALRRLGRDPLRELIGIHFDTGADHDSAYPQAWLSRFGNVQIQTHPEFTGQEADIKRWEAVQSFAINNKRIWMVGSRNATESYLGDFSIASNSCSLFPIINLFKSEVLNLCHRLGVPLTEINRSLNPDPECTVACLFQNRRVPTIDYLTLRACGALDPALHFEPNPRLQSLFEQRREQGRFRLSYHRVPPPAL